MNPRIKQRSVDLVLRLCELYRSPDASVLPWVTAPFVTTKIQSIPWKHIKARLDISVDLIKLYGLSDGKHASDNGWTSTDIVDFTYPFVSHTNQEVRDAVTLLLAHVAVHVPGVLKSLAGSLPQGVVDAIQKKNSAINQTESKRITISQQSSPVCSFLVFILSINISFPV
jgi:hypothetical protein